MAEFDPSTLGTVLGVWAHPDDEAYLSAGIMTMARDVGCRVVCCTATRGEAGSPDPDRWPPSELAAIRTAEMEAALAVIDVHEHHWLTYRDGHSADEGVDVPIKTILGFLESIQPDTVLTFGPDGYTDHPDHKAVSHWVTAAFAEWGNDDATLHYAVQTDDWVDTYAATFELHGVFAPGTPPARPSHELSIDVTLPPAIVERKARALAAQQSQTEGLRALVGDELYLEAFVNTERFRPAF